MSQLILNKQSSAPSSPAAGKVTCYADNTTIARAKMKDEAGNVSFLLDSNYQQANSSVVAASAAYSADTYLAGSACAIPAGTWKANGTYYAAFDMVKTAAGTATPIFTVRMGTLGTTGDAAIVTITFAVGTAAVDTGIFQLWAVFRTVGAGTSAVLQTMMQCSHHLAATGLTTTGASGTGIILATGAGFNSTTQTIIGVSFNGGASFSGTNTTLSATYMQN